MVYSLGAGTTSDFVEAECAYLNLHDKRLNRRAKNILKTLQNKLCSCIRRLFNESREARQAYDFFGNPKVSSEKLLSSHYCQTVERIKSSNSKYILALQDQMYLNFTNHEAKIDLGKIGKTGDTIQYGIIQHSVLCVNDVNEPMGLLDVNHFDYSDFDVSKHRDKRSLKNKANIVWVSALERMRERLGTTDQRIITVADREGDFYEFFHPLIQNNEEFVIRCQHDRKLGKHYKKENQKLREYLKDIPFKGTMNIKIQDTKTREIKKVTLLLKASTIDIPVPKKFNQKETAKHNYTPIRLNAVMAYNEDYQWILLTNLPIETITQIKEVVKIYKSRWHIEDYHKVLKTGYQVDEIYLHSSKEAIKNLLVLASISGCRLYWLIYIGRTEVNVKADKLFEEFEWKSLYVYFGEPIPKESPTIAQAVLMIARLGGYKHSKHSSPPGIKSMWIGYQQLSVAAQVYRNISIKTQA